MTFSRSILITRKDDKKFNFLTKIMDYPLWVTRSWGQKRSVKTESTLTFEAVHLSKRICVLHFIIVPNFLPGRKKVGFVHTRHVIGDKNVYVFKLARRRTMKWNLMLVQALLQTRTARFTPLVRPQPEWLIPDLFCPEWNKVFPILRPLSRLDNRKNPYYNCTLFQAIFIALLMLSNYGPKRFDFFTFPILTL